jgi:hypothetical protein
MKSNNQAIRPDSMIVEPDHIIAARQELGERGFSVVFDDLRSREPALAAYIHEGMAAVAGKMALSGTDSGVVQGMFQETMALLISSIEAQRRGHYDLWRGTTVGTKLEELLTPTPANNPTTETTPNPEVPPTPKSKPRGRRKKDNPEG